MELTNEASHLFEQFNNYEIDLHQVFFALKLFISDFH